MFSIFMRINSQPDVILEIRNIFRTRWSSVAFNRKHIDIMIKSSRHFVSAVIGTVLRRNLIIVCLREGELKCAVVVFFGQGYFKCKKKNQNQIKIERAGNTPEDTQRGQRGLYKK